MKKRFANKTLAVLVAAALLVCLLPVGLFTVSAEAEITVANISIDVPAEGEHPDFTPVSDDEEKYSAVVELWYLYEEPYPHLDNDSVFEHGKKYALRIRFEEKPGYTFAENAVYKINNQSTSCYGSSMHREIIYEVIGTEIDVTSGSQLKDALNRNMPVEAINIVSDITVSYNCTIQFDSEHFPNYQNTVLTINKGVTVTIANDGLLGSFWPSYEGDWGTPPLPNGKVINNGTIIIKNGGGIIGDFDTNNGEVTVQKGGECVCANKNHGTVNVESGGAYLTTQGAKAQNFGTVNVARGGTMQSRFGCTVVNEEGGVINLEGRFICGCVGFEKDIMWFENHGTVNGQGSLILYELAPTEAPVSDMDALIVEAMAQLGQETRFEQGGDVEIYKALQVGSAEALAAAFPGNRVVAGEKVVGDMDVMAIVLTDITVSNGKTVQTRGKIIVTAAGSITLTDSSRLACNMENAGTVEVKNEGMLSTYTGGYIANKGNITIHENGGLASQKGSPVINDNGGTLTLDGEFLCGCLGRDDKDIMWFENHGTVTGRGNITLYEAEEKLAPVSDMDALIERTMSAIGQETRFDNWDDVSIYKLVLIRSYEDLAAALPGNRVVAGEQVAGDMDVRGMIIGNVEIPEGATIETMAKFELYDGFTLTVNSGATLECQLENEGTVNVLSGGKFYTTMGGDIKNKGTITVQQGAELKSQMGGKIKNKKSGTLTIDGELLCGCVGIDGNDEAWFENKGAINGEGAIILYEADRENMAVSDMEGLAESVRAALGEGDSLPEVKIYKSHTAGDINGDGKVNNKDLTRLFQYLSDWDVEVDENALDVNGDGKVNNKDLTRLFQYLSDWEVEIF